MLYLLLLQSVAMILPVGGLTLGGVTSGGSVVPPPPGGAGGDTPPGGRGVTGIGVGEAGAGGGNT